MCYHYSLTKKQEQIMRMIQGEWETPFEPVYHASGFSLPAMPVLTVEKPHMVQAYTWGLIPHWVQHKAGAEAIRTKTLNAKSETLFEKPAFRHAVHHRCIVLADGFFEWMEFKKKKYPHYIQLANQDVFGFAGLYDHWTDKETGEVFPTFTIITTDANPFMARIHNIKKRMPVILQKEAWAQWLHPDLPKEQMQAILKSCDVALQAQTISKQITTYGAATNGSELLEPYAYPELSGEQASLFDL